jgi:hypothetical protein
LRATNTGSKVGWPAGRCAGGRAAMARRRTAWGCGWACPARVAEGFMQRRPGGAQLLSSGIHAAELFGELEGAFGLGAVGQEAAGLSAHWLLACQGLLVAPAGSSSLWLACLEPVLAVALVRWRQHMAGARRSAVAGSGLGCLPERWRSCRRVPGNRCRTRVLGANPSLRQGQGSLVGSPAGGYLAQLVQHDLEARSSLGDIGMIRA